jgi:glycosyltransferase involved in cell wall biosynthesis
MAACVATSRTTLEEAIAFGIPAERVHLLGNGVDTRLFHPATPPERLAEQTSLGVNATGLVIFVGRLSPEKNPDGLLTAWQSARKELPDGWRLVLLGDGPMRDMLTSAIESSAQGEEVRLAGSQKDVERWMRAADVYVLTSHHEGLSNTTLEAMASGLPVITTRVSGSAETVGETGAGIVVDVGRMDQLEAALIRLVRDAPLREQMGRIGRELIAEKYSIEHVAEAHLGLYQRLVAGAQTSRGSH